LGFEPWTQSRTVPVWVTLDPSGRPYDAEVTHGRTVERGHLGELATPDGELLMMDGDGVIIDPAFFAEEIVSVTVAPDLVDEAGVSVINVDVLWEVWPDSGKSVLGIWLGSTDAPVEAWDPFEQAYGTWGDSGGVFTNSVLDLAQNLEDGEFIEDVDYWATYQLWDLDHIAGDDTLVFHNGWGDFDFPLSRGRDAEGNVVVVVIWHREMLWRLALPQSAPPADVVEQEEEFIECLVGTRPIHVTGWCLFSDSGP